MLIPAWLVALLATLYTLEYIRRFLYSPREGYLALGKAIGRSILAGVYWYFVFFSPTEAQRQVLVRWSLFLFLTIDLIYIVQEYFMHRRQHHGK